MASETKRVETASAQHTPAPWRFCRGEIAPSGNRYFPHVHLGGAADRGIRSCGNRDVVINEGATFDECEANAKLIAAAPALADALEQAAKYLRGGAPVAMALDAIDHALRAAGRIAP